LPLCLAFGLVVVFFVYARAAEQARITRAFERQASALANTLDDSIHGYLEVLQAIESYYASTRDMSRPKFRTFVQRLFSRHPGIQALSWDRRVLDGERAAYEEAVRQEGYPAFEITEQNAQGQLVRAAQRPEYVAVSYIEPAAGNESALGYDAASTVDRLEALQHARDTGEPRATGRTILVQETGQQFGLLIFLPIYSRELPHDTVEERRRNLHGYTTVVLRIDDMVEASLRAFERDGVVLRIYDETAPEDARLLYSQQQLAQGGMERPFDKIDRENVAGLHWRTSCEVAGRQWTLRFSPTLAYLTAQRTWYAWAVLASGLLFVGLLGGFLLVLTGRAISMEHLAAERTTTNARLAREIAEHKQTTEALAVHTQRLEAVQQVTSELTRELHLPTLLNLIIQRAVVLIGASGGGSIHLWDEAAQVLRTGAWYRMGGWIQELRIRLGEGVVGTVAQQRQGLVVDNYQQSPYANRTLVEHAGSLAVIAEPLLYRERLIGALIVGHGTPGHRFTAADQNLLALLAHEAAIAIENAQLFEAARAQATQLAEVNAALRSEIAERTRAEAALAAEARFLHAQTAVAAAALSSLDADTLAFQLLAAVCQAQEYAHGLLWRTVDEGRTAVVVASYGDETTSFLGYRVRLDEPITFTAQVIHSRQPRFCNRVSESPHATHPIVEAFGGQALLGLPLVSRTGHVLGALVCGDAHNPERFAARDLQQGAVLAHQVAQALENSVLFQQLQRLEEQYRVVTETLHDAVYMVNQDGHIVFANAALERLTGYHTAELLAQPSLMLYPPAVMPELLQRRNAIFSGHDVSAYMQMPIQHKQGQQILVELSHAALSQDGQITGYVVVARDLTERLHLEAQLRQVQKLQAIGTLAGGIAHDFNNILSAILGYTELALTGVPPTAPVWYNLEQVLIAGRRAKDLVQQILTFSRQGEQEGQPVQLARLVTEALTLLRAALPSTIAIRRELHEEAGTVLADPTQLHQVLMNLCTNAAHAMRDVGGVLTVDLDACEVTAPEAVHPELAPGSYLRLMVRDTGHGMPPEIMERIFEPFFTTKGMGEGTGMGLAVVHGIVTKCGGVIAVESAPGHGTIFTVYLPRGDQPVAALAGPEDAVPRGSERILFVDDEEALAQLGHLLLTGLGYDVVTYTSSVEALEAFRAQPDRFDLVITDQTMPDMTGDVLVCALRQMRPDLPIIVCTGFSQRLMAGPAEAIDIDAVCLKPLVARDLARTIRQVFAQRTA